MKTRKSGLLVLTAIVATGALAGCSNGHSGKSVSNSAGSSVTPTSTKSKEPVELTVVSYWAHFPDFDNLIANSVHEKFPWITLKENKTAPDKLAASGQFPDMFLVGNSRYTVFKDLNVPFDMSAYVKSNKMDMSKFAKPNVDWVKDLGSKGEVFGIPFEMNQYALFYNKDLFDKRGVAYPKDGMTWDDVLELSKKMTFFDNGVQYRGMVPPSPEYFARMRSMPFVDSKTNAALLDNAAFRSILELEKSFYDIPGMVNNKQYPIKKADFIKDQTVAMLTSWMDDVPLKMMQANVKINFDLVGAPSFKDLPNQTMDPGAMMLGISNSSKHKDEAWQVIQYLVSPEIQTKISRSGFVTALADDAIRNQFGADQPLYKGKNIAGGLKVSPAVIPPPNRYSALATTSINKVIKDLVLGNQDINTLLRQAQENADKAIQDQIASKK